MKIETGYFRQTIKIPRIHFNILKLDGKIRPTSLVFTVEVGSTNELPYPIEVRLLTIENWFKAMLENRLVKLAGEFAHPEFEVLDVEDTAIPYIVKTLFQILTQLMPDQIHLNSISYE